MPRSFEELEIWQKALKMSKLIYRVTESEKFKKDYSLTDQIRRASVSVLSNIAEGFERGSNVEFIQFLYIAKGSCGEVRAQLYLTKELGYIDDAGFKNLLELCKDISSQLSGLINYLKGSRLKGEKFKTNYKSMKVEVEELLKEFNIQDSKFKHPNI
ncbi:MAG: four helix bundle protein [Thermodesulfovibrionales bacterium]